MIPDFDGRRVALCTARFLFIAVVTAIIGFAQQDNASLLGIVMDSSGAVVPGAGVTVQNQSTSVSVKLETGAQGNFIAPVLPVGTYRVTVAAKGFQTYELSNITLRVSDRTKVDIALKPGMVTERITVEGAAPLVETASTTLGGVIGSQQVNELPLRGRSITRMITLVPGVVMLGPQTLNGTSIGRLFETGTKFLVDGADAGQVDSDGPEAGYWSSSRISRTSVEAVEETRVYTTLFSSEFGQALGGVVNFITRSGTNEFHGTLFEYFRADRSGLRAAGSRRGRTHAPREDRLAERPAQHRRFPDAADRHLRQRRPQHPEGPFDLQFRLLGVQGFPLPRAASRTVPGGNLQHIQRAAVRCSERGSFGAGAFWPELRHHHFGAADAARLALVFLNPR